MKLLRIKADNYRNCEDAMTIDFVPIARKNEEDLTYELNLVDEGLYTFATSAIIGKNASGKTSVLKLIEDVFQLLGSFQLQDEPLSIDGTAWEITFYHEGKIYCYQTTMKKQKKVSGNLSFVNEHIFQMDYYKTKSNKIFNHKLYKELFIQRELPDDVSMLFYILKERNTYAYSYDDTCHKDGSYHDIYMRYEQGELPKRYWEHILHIFDENILSLEELTNDIFRLHYQNKVIELSAKELFHMLSSGTTKGISLYTAAIQSLLEGTVLIIDEIENHFHKTLVENIIGLYKDKSVNKHGASLIFSTHYCELLDLFARNDNIWITKTDNMMMLTNMYKHYGIRNDVLKSKKFYENAFATAVDYDSLMNLKRNLINEQ